MLRASMGGDELGGRDGVAALAAQVGRGDEPAQRRPALARGESDGPAAAPGEHGDPWQARVDEGPSSHRRAHGPAGTGPLARGGSRARSTPRIGAMPCSMQARTNFTAP